MPYSNALSLGDLDLNFESWRSTKNFSQGSRFTIPLATATFCLLNSNIPALAKDLNTQVAEGQITVSYPSFNLDSTSKYFHERQHNDHHDVSFLSRIFNLITSPWQNHFGNLSQIHSSSAESSEILHSNGIGGHSVRDFTPMYLALAESSSSPEFSIASTIIPIGAFDKTPISSAEVELTTHTVKTGDTISSIAKKYQVSRKELIALNKIKNSNIIFVNQQLKLPATKLNPVNPLGVEKIAVIKDTTASKNVTFTAVEFPHDSARVKTSSSVSQNYLADLRLKSGNLSKLNVGTNTSSNTFQDERLAKLRSDIERMRSEIKQERARDHVKEEAEQVDQIDLVSSLDYAEDLNVSSISEKAISLKLPPLPPSEEYLPEAFEGYSWPAQGVLSSGYGWRWGRLHKGIDIAAPVGTPIFAAAAGEVISAGWNSGGYGNLVKLRHLDGSMTLYAHNHRILVNKGQKVYQGEQIAEMGNTGFSTGSHLHFEIHARNRGVVDPLAFLSRN